MKGIRTTLYTAACLVGLALILTASPATADQVILDDLIVDGSLCVGFDCVNGESFGFDTIRLKENNLRIHFNDTSSAASFPPNDWRIIINDSTNGGDSYFGVEDSSAGRIPFRVVAGARANALYVDAQGDVGIGTSTPVVDLHVKTGDTPTLRLEQDGTSGFQPQTWDVAGNETNFFIRDVTNGSRLPIRSRPDAPTSSIDVAASGNVGFGASSPSQDLHVLRSDSNSTFIRVENTNGTAQDTGFQFINGNSTWNFFNQGAGNPGDFTINAGGGGIGAVLRLDDANGDVYILQGDLNISGGNCSDDPGGGGCTPDYVFEPDYELLSLEELSAFVSENRHLPNVPSAAQVEADGINMRRFNFAMLEKIEELVLYTIQQQETINRLSERLEALEVRSE